MRAVHTPRRLLVFPQVDEATGAFRLKVPPGAYVVSQIGPPIQPDRHTTWPRLVLCVPATQAEVVNVGHLQLLGTRYRETYTLSTGSEQVSQGVRYRFAVVDEGGAGRRWLFRELPDLPDLPNLSIGQRLQERWQQDKAGLIRQICGSGG